MTFIPSEFVRDWLVARNFASQPEGSQPWPAFVSELPDRPGSQVNALVVVDRTAIKVARLSKTGEVIERPGIQIVIRSADYATGRAKGIALLEFFDSVNWDSVEWKESFYTVTSVSRTSGLIPLEMPSDDRAKRVLHSLNFTFYVNP